MRFEEMLKNEHENGLKEGFNRGMEQGRELVRHMTVDGRSADIPKLQSDPLFYQEMMEKYGISER